MLAYSSVIRDAIKVTASYGKLKNERMVGKFDRSAGRLLRRRENLHARTESSPGTEHTETAEAIFSPHFVWAREDRLVDLLANLLPFGCIECRTGLRLNDLSTSKREFDFAGCARKRKIQRIGISIATVVLAWASNAHIHKQPEFG